MTDVLRMEAALCIWEAMLEARPKMYLKEKDRVRPWQIQLDMTWGKRGTVEMRHLAIGMADHALTAFDLIGGTDGAEALELLPYDWGFIPAFVSKVDWNDCVAEPAAIAAALKQEKSQPEPLAREA